MTDNQKSLAEELADLEIDLQDAIQVEDYNLAAKIRDRINELSTVLLEKALEEETRLVEEKLQKLEAEKKELLDKLQRVSAEFDNFQKRTKKDKERWITEATRKVLTGLLPALDNLDSVINASNEADVDNSFKQGLRLVEGAFATALSAYQVEKIQPAIGDIFDSSQHSAISIQHVEDNEGETVGFITRPGYKIGTVVIRPADVVVNKNTN